MCSVLRGVVLRKRWEEGRGISCFQQHPRSPRGDTSQGRGVPWGNTLHSCRTHIDFIRQIYTGENILTEKGRPRVLGAFSRTTGGSERTNKEGKIGKKPWKNDTRKGRFTHSKSVT